ncbi:MAG TPA: hypothetical protein VK517_18155 [Cyclobacteriaceae bacterium]|nr:hypothetical protein [Cyclobacteriaceae bacterium]
MKATTEGAEKPLRSGESTLPKIVMRIKWTQIVQKISEEELRNNSGDYLPLFIQLKKDTLIFSNKSLNRIDFLSINGELISSIGYGGFGVIDVVKFYYQRGVLYLLDPYRGLFVIDVFKNKLVYKDDRTINFFSTLNDNLFYQNSMSRKPSVLEVLPNNSALIDKIGVLKKPLEQNYYSIFVNDSLLTGVKFLGQNFDSPFQVETLRLGDLTLVKEISLDSVCSSCFFFPRMLSEKLIVATNTKSGKNYLYEITDEGKLSRHELVVPNEFRPLLGFEYTPFYNAGFNFDFNPITRELFAIGADEKEIILFSYDLSEILH